MTGPLGGHVGLERGGEIVVGSAGPQQAAQVDLVDREEAVPEVAVGGETDPVAAPAERSGDAGDHAELAGAIAVPESCGGIVALVERFQRVDPTDPLDDLLEGDDAVTGPSAVRIERHVLDESDRHPTLASVRREVEEFVVVDAAHHDGVDLHRVQPDFNCGVDAIEHLNELVAPRQLEESVGPERIEGHVDALEASVDQLVGEQAEGGPVRGEGEIDSESRQHAHEAREMGSDGRLTSGQPDAVDAVSLDDEPGQPLDLLERQDLVAGGPRHAFFGHAVGAPEVASVGDRDPEVPVDPPEGVDELVPHETSLRSRAAEQQFDHLGTPRPHRPNVVIWSECPYIRSMSLVVLALIGIAIGLSLGSVGAGGSILAVPALVYVVDQPATVATTGSLAVVMATALIAVRPHWRLGNVRLDIAVPFGVVGVAGSFAGKTMGDHIDPDVLMLAFSGVMVAAATMMAWRTRSGRPDCRPDVAHHDDPAAQAPMPRIVALGFAVGLMTGFFGVGGGFVIVPALVLALGLSMPHAIGTSLVIIAINSASAFALKAPGVDLDWRVLAVFTAAAGTGALFGERITRRADEATLTRTFAVAVYAIALYTAIRSVTGLVG